MSNPFIGEIRMFAGNFAPKNWATCDGQLQSISQNTALFSLLGTFYGGNGTSTFGLPNLAARVPIHSGQGPGLSDYQLGQASGAPTVTLLTSEMPIHSHARGVSSVPGTSATPVGNVLAESSTATFSAATSNTTMQPLTPTGGNQPHENMQPYLAVTFIICLRGVFPTRN